MLFNSIDFALFLPIIFILYWFFTRKNLKLQNLLIVASSYIFYGWWDWRFLFLLVFSSLIDYFVGLALSKEKIKKKRNILLLSSLLVNLGFLSLFKYFNFFAESFADSFSLFGVHFEPTRLNLVLPVGISFYTFQTLSYTIDVYRDKLKPTKDIISFLAFVSFFPQLVAGPIERATNLLPQFTKPRFFNYEKVFDGFKQVLWGLFKKVVIADSCAIIANEVFNNYANYSGSTLFLGAFFFAFQIYGDFSGYSDIAIGTARMFGFNLKQNFNYPYFSRDIAEFWRRWHISLSTWFRDYVYIPLGGSKKSKLLNIRNVLIVFLISGFWHGAKWTFVFWGLINALCFIPIFILKLNRRNIEVVAYKKIFPNFREVFQMLSTFCIVLFGWIFFRSDSLWDAFSYLNTIFSRSFFTIPYVFGIGMNRVLFTSFFIVLLIFLEWFGRNKEYPIYFEKSKSKLMQWLICYAMLIIVFLFGEKQQDFIYFQF